MTVRASQSALIIDTAAGVILRERGLAETVTTHAPGVRVPRKGIPPYWQTPGDYDWQLSISYETSGAEPHSVEIWASDNAALPAAFVLGIPLPASASGTTRALVCESSLRGIDYDGPLYLSVRLVVIAGGSVDCGVSLERAN